MYILINVFYLIVAFKWGDWRNWRVYYPTILFFIMGDFLYNFLLYKKSMWLFHDLILPNHTIITILAMVVSYSATVLIYLGRFPEDWNKRFIWFLLWIGIYLSVEYFNSRFGFITYHNGWNIWWSTIYRYYFRYFTDTPKKTYFSLGIINSDNSIAVKYL